jgi:hypothetical protein
MLHMRQSLTGLQLQLSNGVVFLWADKQQTVLSAGLIAAAGVAWG